MCAHTHGAPCHESRSAARRGGTIAAVSPSFLSYKRTDGQGKAKKEGSGLARIMHGTPSRDRIVNAGEPLQESWWERTCVGIGSMKQVGGQGESDCREPDLVVIIVWVSHAYAFSQEQSGHAG